MNTKQQFKKSMSEYRQELTEAYKKDNKAQFHTVMNRNKFRLLPFFYLAICWHVAFPCVVPLSRR